MDETTADDWMSTALAYTTSVDQNAATTAATASTNAIQGMTPANGSSGGAWGDFWQKNIGRGLDYIIKRDAVQSGVVLSPGQQLQVQQAQASGFTLSPQMLLIGAVVVAAVLALRK